MWLKRLSAFPARNSRGFRKHQDPALSRTGRKDCLPGASSLIPRVFTHTALLAVVLLVLAGPNGSTEQGASPPKLSEYSPADQDSINPWPMAFEENRGLTEARVIFTSQGSGYGIFVTELETVSAFRASNRVKGSSVLRISFSGANPTPKLHDQIRMLGTVNYLKYPDTKAWQVDTPAYHSVVAEKVFAGSELIYKCESGRLEYDLVVASEAEIESLEVPFQGVDTFELVV